MSTLQRLAAVVVFCFALVGCSTTQQEAFSTTLPTPDLYTRGKALFLNRGCATCHNHQAFQNISQSVDEGPDLTVYRGDEAFLRNWLHNPAAVRPGTLMPTVGLSEQEIDALVVFLLQPEP